ncbi:MAG: hypothetical protein IPO21_18700 [Bacteroidales bacterium]|nr:hypothetical protein [Bacteroidales bacterium]
MKENKFSTEEGNGKRRRNSESQKEFKPKRVYSTTTFKKTDGKSSEGGYKKRSDNKEFGASEGYKKKSYSDDKFPKTDGFKKKSFSKDGDGSQSEFKKKSSYSDYKQSGDGYKKKSYSNDGFGGESGFKKKAIHQTNLNREMVIRKKPIQTMEMVVIQALRKEVSQKMA